MTLVEASDTTAPPTQLHENGLKKLAREDLRRLIVALINDELSVTGQNQLPRVLVDRVGRSDNDATTDPNWQSVDLGADGLGIDSIAMLSVAGRIAEFFGLNGTGLEDHLLLARDLGGLVDVAAASLQRDDPVIAPRSSGTSRKPRAVAHDWSVLGPEVSAPDYLPGTGKVLTWVPPHHLYGFLFSVLAPRLSGRPIRDCRGRSVAAVLREAQMGDVIIATAPFWQAADRAAASAPGVHGISAGSMLSPEVWRLKEAAALSSLHDIYGSAETAGIGRRTAPGPFALMPHLKWGSAGTSVQRRNCGTRIDPPDKIERIGAGFGLRGRRDDAICVAGVTVDPRRVASVIEALPAVQAASVRLDETVCPPRLKAFVAIA
ncbi:MAG: hypothetical protein AAFT19_10705, partial [Pseudomonadota bacterium]